MDKLSFVGGAYSARSVIASAQRCVNYYPEVNPKDSSFQLTLYQRPGLRSRAVASGRSVWRFVYQASNGIGYGVCGDGVYLIGPPPSWSLTLLGTITPGRTNPCSIIDNGIQALLVDGSASGWQWNIADGSGFQIVVDGTGTFQGATRVDTLDTFVLWAPQIPEGPYWGSTLSGSLTFDPLYFASKVAYPDPLRTLVVNRRQILLLGALKSEIWYNAGNALFPFAILPGAYIEHGISAKYSVATSDISAFWLGKDLQGDGMVVFRQRGYETKIISNHAISYALRKMSLSVGVSDAIGYTYQQDGHYFYVLHFPAGDQTWVFDDALGVPEAAWHQRAWSDANGILHRERNNCFANLYGRNVTGDWENGTLYEMDPDYYRDDMAGTPMAISFIRGFSHLLAGANLQGQTVPSHGVAIHHQSFWLALECGTDPTPNPGDQITLRWSDDWGRTFGNGVLQSAGELGEYVTQPQWPGTGLSKFRLYEVYHSIPGPAALNGAWVMGRLENQNR